MMYKRSTSLSPHTIKGPRTSLFYFFVGTVLLINYLISTTAFGNQDLSSSPRSNSFSLRDIGGSTSGLFSAHTLGFADTLLPLFGSDSARNFFYLNPQVLYRGGNAYRTSLGAGARWLSDSAGILGAYLFADYENAGGHGFWYLSPGIERLGKTVDLSMNFYFPVNSQRRYNGIYFADQLGIQDQIHFSGHTQYDQLINTYTESLGIGADAEIGVRLPLTHNPKIYLGTYYFNPKDNPNILGATFRAEIPLTTHTSLSLSDGYDRLSHNTIKAGLTLYFGTRKSDINFKGDLNDRMLAPIQRNLSIIAGDNLGKTIQVRRPGNRAIEYNDITFFNKGGTTNPNDLQDGSFEHPYQAFNQDNIDAANQINNRRFYINTGTYTVNTPLTLTNDSLWGRETYNNTPFLAPAKNANRPLLDFSSLPSSTTGASLRINQDGQDIVVDSLRLQGNSHANAKEQDGLEIINTSTHPVDVTLNNLDSSGFRYGVTVRNTENAEIKELTVRNSHFDENTYEGFYLSNAGTLDTIALAHITANRNTDAGIYLENEGTIGDITLNDVAANNNDNLGIDIHNQKDNSSMGNITLNNVNVDNNYNGLTFHNYGSNTKMGDITLNYVSANNNHIGITFSNNYSASRHKNTMGNITLAHVTTNSSNTGIYVLNKNNSTIGQINIVDSTIENNRWGIYILNDDSFIQGINIHNTLVDSNTTGLAVYNDHNGKIGDKNTVYYNNNTGHNPKPFACRGATVKTEDDDPVLCPASD